MCVFVLYQCCLSLCRRWSSSRSLCPGLPTGSWSETNTHKVKEKCTPFRKILNLTSFFELEFIKYWCMKVYRNRKNYDVKKLFCLEKKMFAHWMFFRHSVKKLILDTECDDTTANAPNDSTGEHQVWACWRGLTSSLWAPSHPKLLVGLSYSPEPKPGDAGGTKISWTYCNV